MSKIIKQALTFDDVLLVPNYSEVLPHQASLKTKLGKIELNIPILSAAMDTVTEHQMAIALANLGGLGIIHKNMPLEKQITEIQKVKSHTEIAENACVDEKGKLCVGLAFGVNIDFEHLEKLIAIGLDVLLIDSSHGYSKGVLDCVKNVKSKFPDLTVIAGNVATASGALELAKAGADVIKVGIGPGSICTTRIVTGVGVPQITAILDVADALKNSNCSIIADGGIRYSGDISKALACGANAVMLGNLLAGSTQAPGEILEIDGNLFKAYRGMGSIAAMKKGSADRYFQNNSKKLVPEGVEGTIRFKGEVEAIIEQQIGGLRSAMGLTGSKDIDALHKNAHFVQITASGMSESHAHNLHNFQNNANYQKK